MDKGEKGGKGVPGPMRGLRAASAHGNLQYVQVKCRVANT